MPNQLRSTCGKSLIQVVIAMGIMSLVLAVILFMKSIQQRETKSLSEKLSSFDFERSATKVLAFIMQFSNAIVIDNKSNVRIVVTDEEGRPVMGASVGLGRVRASGIDSVRGVTDADGRYSAPDGGAYQVNVVAKKLGYYDSNLRLFKWVRDSNITLKKKLSPIALYAKKTSLQPPVHGQYVGFDFERGDFVGPYGHGLVSDLKIKVDFDRKDFWNYTYKLVIKFSNPKDGLIPFVPKAPESELKSDYIAPEVGYLGS